MKDVGLIFLRVEYFKLRKFIVERKIDKKNIGERIWKIRNKLGLNLEEFGNLQNIKAERSNVSKWERGLTLPNKKRLLEIAKLGNMTVNELLYGSVYEFEELTERALNLSKDEKIKLINELLDSI